MSHIIFYMASGPFPGVMNIWINVAVLVCHHRMVTMELCDTILSNGNLSPFYVDEIMEFTEECTKTWVEVFGSRFTDYANGTYSITNTRNDVLRQSRRKFMEENPWDVDK